jgi:protein-S-isoprenylcysteine O-methyltransferase Ste14
MTGIHPLHIVALWWLVFLVVWSVASLNVRRTKRLEDRRSRSRFTALTAIGSLLLAFPRARFLSPLRFSWSPWLPWVGAAMVTVGILFAFWARFTLGRNWSGRVTLKEGHELIQTGPYALARHPIYTGLDLALWGTALAEGTVAALVGAACLAYAFSLRMKLEEQWMVEEFGERYQEYRKRVPGLVPWLGRRG